MSDWKPDLAPALKSNMAADLALRQFTGRELDASGLYFYRARYYHPGMGRFILEDPLHLNGGLNFYAYVGGDPINRVDPLGLVEVHYQGNVDASGRCGFNDQCLPIRSGKVRRAYRGSGCGVVGC